MSRPQLDICFARHPQRGTYLSRRVFRYPFQISRGFQLDHVPAGMLTLILQTVSGGILAEDSLRQRVHVEPGAAAHLTGQGATPVYRSPDRTAAADRIELSVADGGVLEYLPEPRILFPCSRIDQALVVRTDPGGIAVVADGFLAHDPDGAGRSFGRYTSEIVIERPGGIVCSQDRIALDCAPVRAGARARYVATGSLTVVAPPGTAVGEAIEKKVAALEGAYCAVTALPGEAGVSLRIAAEGGQQLRRAIERGWSAAREALFGEPPASRRKDYAQSQSD
jgi:urease accessory protein